MKKFLEEKHDLLAGIFAVLAFVAIVCEIVLGGFTKEGVVAGIKDLSGILIDVLVLAVAASVLIRKHMNFKEKFQKAMDELEKKYSPILIADNIETCIRYNIASNPKALFSEQVKSPKRIFQLNKNDPDSISFYVTKSFFNSIGGTGYDPEKIASQIAFRLKSVPAYSKYDIDTFPNKENYVIEVKFNHILDSDEDIADLISLIDYALFLFVARNDT